MIIKSNVRIGFEVYLQINEVEARALLAIAGYGNKEFLEIFYKSLGKSGLGPNEAGLISLFDTIKTELPDHIARFDRTLWLSRC